jgi:hypothetical protein
MWTTVGHCFFPIILSSAWFRTESFLCHLTWQDFAPFIEHTVEEAGPYTRCWSPHTSRPVLNALLILFHVYIYVFSVACYRKYFQPVRCVKINGLWNRAFSWVRNSFVQTYTDLIFRVFWRWRRCLLRSICYLATKLQGIILQRTQCTG